MDPAAPSSRAPRPLSHRVIPPKPLLSAVVVLLFTGALYVIEGIDTVLLGALDANGVRPRAWSEWDNLLWAPVLHAGWDHLIANSLPLLVLAFLASSGGVRQFFQVTAVIWLASGLGVWVFGSVGVHLGASGLIFGYLTFLLVRGVFVRSAWQIVVAIAVFAVYGAVLWGVLPGQPGISWEGHLFGAVGGVLAAWGVAQDAKAERKRANVVT
ncbi:rhomboid family intramembrane serine protease [Actinosynnema pretiosum subsp. pretiosum]|uniref:Rhomboid family intramembrane serine protease n=1 Tax=Actinosynnema pretiosum subsp. pretiosum TaxID=103721 RepID=A0AA45LCN5_9PSEU|nr:Rhomboid family protein [Actinosynnema pretiosum subsp. pretiosum]QUF07295.1 rhomboid family intramembrane serine protease [Actinosynnema pretiosum subsp. pretiosum]